MHFVIVYNYVLVNLYMLVTVRPTHFCLLRYTRVSFIKKGLTYNSQTLILSPKISKFVVRLTSVITLIELTP